MRIAIAFLVIIFIGILIVLFGWYPSAIVNNHIIWKKEVDTVSRATITYYQHTLSTLSSTIAITPEITAEVRKQALETLIDQTLIADAVRIVVSDAEINALIQEKVTHSEQPEFNVAISLIYGLNPSGFYDLIVKPEAEKELLKQKNNWDDTAFDKWRAEERAGARIIRFGKN